MHIIATGSAPPVPPEEGMMSTSPAEIIAIDILLKPDAQMLQHAAVNNERLLKIFPHGFALDAEHRPHITMVQRFVHAEDLEKVYAAIGNVLHSANATAMKLVAFKYYYAPGPGVGVAGI
jgi:hypothetical protein